MRAEWRWPRRRIGAHSCCSVRARASARASAQPRASAPGTAGERDLLLLPSALSMPSGTSFFFAFLSASASFSCTRRARRRPSHRAARCGHSARSTRAARPQPPNARRVTDLRVLLLRRLCLALRGARRRARAAKPRGGGVRVRNTPHADLRTLGRRGAARRGAARRGKRPAAHCGGQQAARARGRARHRQDALLQRRHPQRCHA